MVESFAIENQGCKHEIHNNDYVALALLSELTIDCT